MERNITLSNSTVEKNEETLSSEKHNDSKADNKIRSQNEIKQETQKKISIFETIIREVGGLLSAYDLSSDEIFKQKALDLVEKLMPAFDSNTGVFYTYFNPSNLQRDMASWHSGRATIADVGTLQLEMRYLTSITGDSKYQDAGDAFYEILKREGSYHNTGLYPVHFDQRKGKFSDKNTYMTMGSLADSFYEYLLKCWLYSGKTEDWLRQAYDDAIDGMAAHLLATSTEDNVVFLKELTIPSMTGRDKMDHLLCFVPGMIALGTISLPVDSEKRKKHLGLAESLAETCYQMYSRTATGLSPDVVQFPGFKVNDAQYRLRPEAVESFFYLYRVTHDSKYREWGWEIFNAIEKNCKTEHGYAALKDVTNPKSRLDDKMESFFLAETLKYHYLLQGPDSVLPLDKYVFNTEAHPLRVLDNL